MFKYFKNQMRLYKDARLNRQFYKKVYNLYELQKEMLLEINRKGDDKIREQILIYEINILAGVLNENIINKDDVSATLTVYPDTLY